MIRALSALLGLASVLLWALTVDIRDTPGSGIGGARGEWE